MLKEDTAPTQNRTQDVDDLERELSTTDLASAPHGTTLTAQELYVLEKAGYEVVNVVIGNIVYSMGLRGMLKNFRKAFIRGEMTDFTRMNRDARELARNRMLDEARAIGATSVIDIVFMTHEYADFIEITAIGTAVKRVREASELPIAVSASS